MKLLLCALLTGTGLTTATTAFAQSDRSLEGKRVERETQNPVLKEDEIAQVVMTLDDGEVDAAKYARKHAKDGKVKDFAKMMEDVHVKNKKETKDLAKKLKLSPRKNELSEGLEKKAMANNKDTKKAEKDAFDKTYVNEQVMMHEDALATIEQKLLPMQMGPEMRAHLEKTKASVMEHLAHAQQLQNEIK